MSSGKDKDNVIQMIARNLYQSLINESEKPIKMTNQISLVLRIKTSLEDST